MVDTNKLRGAIKAKGLTIAEAANLINISEATMQRKLKTGIFGSDEIDRMVEKYDIRRPSEIFFVRKYPKKLPNETV